MRRGYSGYVHLFGWARALKAAGHWGSGLCEGLKRCTFGRHDIRRAKPGYVHLGVHSQELSAIRKRMVSAWYTILVVVMAGFVLATGKAKSTFSDAEGFAATIQEARCINSLMCEIMLNSSDTSIVNTALFGRWKFVRSEYRVRMVRSELSKEQIEIDFRKDLRADFYADDDTKSQISYSYSIDKDRITWRRGCVIDYGKIISVNKDSLNLVLQDRWPFDTLVLARIARIK